MEMSVSEAKARLTDLVRRAEAGDEVVLTRHGQPVVELVRLTRKSNTHLRAAAIADFRREAAKTLLPGPCAARSQDFLYDEHGLPD